MLVLVRQRDEDVYIATPEGRITIRILGVQTVYEGQPCSPRVRLGIEAPAAFNVARAELLHGNNVEGTPVALDVSNNGKASAGAE